MGGNSIYAENGFAIDNVPDPSKLKETLVSQGFFVQKVSSSIARCENLTVIGNNDLDSLITFAKELGIKILMMDSVILNKDSYKMDVDFNDEYDFIDDDIREYNRMIDEMDFSKPYDLFVFFIYEGSPYGIFFVDSELNEIVSVSPEDRLSAIKDRHEEEIDQAREERFRRYRVAEEKVVELLAEEEGFDICTNQASRVAFLRNFLDRDGNEDLKKAICFDGMFTSNNSLKPIGDRAWAIVKSKKN